MNNSGIYSELLYIDERAPPIVYGEVRSLSNPHGKTILFYNHYDVQPVEPRDRWELDPFSGIIKDGKVYGRGSADDKGELITRIKAVESFLRKIGEVPCNVKFLVEGEEEIGSPNLKKYLYKFQNLLKCDAIIWEFGYVDTNDRPIINLGMKGILYVELTAIGPSQDIHSSFAVLVKNPAWHLNRALNTIWDETNARILVEDWYKEYRKLSEEELFFMANQPAFDETGFKKTYKIARFLNDLQGDEVKRALIRAPTCNISGLFSGYLGKGAKTILPSYAKVKLDFRLVPDMNPRTQFERLKRHLKVKGFNDIISTYIHGISASRTSHTNVFVNQVKQAAEESFGKTPIVNLSSAGTGPMSLLVDALNSPCLAVGSTFIFANIHSYNEFARIDLLNKGTKCMVGIIERFADSSGVT